MEIKYLFMALLATSCIIGIVGFQGNLGDNYGVTTAKNLSYLSKAQETGNKINDTFNSINITILGRDNVFGAFIDPIAGYTIATLKLFTIFFDIPGIFIGLITETAEVFGNAGIPIPPWFLGIIFAIIIMSLVFAFIRFIRGGGTEI